MARINIPGVGLVDFPDSMSEAEIADAIENDILKTSAPKEESSFIDKAGKFAGDTARKIGTTAMRKVVEAGDIGLGLLGGTTLVPDAAIGLADIASGGRAGKALEDAGYDSKQAREFLDSKQSDALKESNKAVADADGFVDTTLAAIKNPRAIVDTVAKSAPLMLGGGVVGAGVRAAGATPYIAGAVGEGLLGAGIAAEGTRQETKDGLLTGKQSALSLASGVGTALTGALGGKLAQKLGIADIDTVLAGGGVDQVNKSLTKRLVLGGLAEGVFEEMPQSAQEQVLSNMALDKPLMEGVSEAAAMGMLAGAATGGAASAVVTRKDASGANKDVLVVGDNSADDATAAKLQQQYEQQNAQQEADAALAGIGEAATVDDAIALATETIKTPLTPKSEAIDASELLEDANVSATNDATGLATIASGLVDNQPIGSAGDSVLQPIINSDTGLDSNAEAFTKSSGFGDIVREDNSTNGALNEIAPIESPEQVAGEKLDKEWTAFTAESGSLGIPRAEMPQIKAENRGAMTNFLNARGISHEQVEVPSNELKPTQLEFSQRKIEKAKLFKGGDRSILISADNHVLDGHHQWMAKLSKGEPIDAIRLNAPISELIDVVKEFPSATTAAGSSQAETVSPTQAAPALDSVSPENNLRPLVESLVKRRAAAAQSGMAKSFDNVVAAAKDLMEGKPVSPAKLKTQANLFKNKDKEISDILMAMHDEALNTPDALAAKENRSATAKNIANQRMKLNLESDGLMTAIAKLGGLNSAKAQSEFGIDPADMKQYGAGITRTFKSNGMDMDAMRELLLEQGYPVGETVADFGDALADAMNGIDVLTPEGQEALARKKFEEYSRIQSELSDNEQQLLDELIAEATAKYGADTVAEIDASVAAGMSGQPMVEIERALIKRLQGDLNEQSNTGNRQATESNAGEDSESSSGQADERSAQQESQPVTERRAQGENRVERRADEVTRKNVADMSADEMRRALLIDDLTGIGNRRAYDESVKKPFQVSIDADGLKWINDNLGHESGDILLKAIGEAIGRVTTDGYHISGDEFVVQAGTEIAAADIMETVNELLAQAVVEGVNSNGDKVNLKGIGISYGIAKDLKYAETKLQQHKQERETTGQRSGRGEQPTNATITSQRSENNQDNATSQTDLLGQDTSKQQALADAERAKDAKRNSGTDNQDTFTLTGSNSEADKAAANGAQDLFAGTGKMVDKPNALKDTSDVGGELLGNRRNKGLTLADIQNANNDTERVAMAVKTKIWERPDYQALVDSGVQPVIAHIVKQVYDGISSKPSYKGEKFLYHYVETVEATRKAVDSLLADETAMANMIVAVAVKARQQSWMMSGNSVKDIARLSPSSETVVENALDYLVDKVFPKNETGERWGRKNAEGNDKANATGNRFYKQISINLNSFVDAMRAVEQGFPAKQEAWERSYRIEEKDGKFALIKKGRYSPISTHESREDAAEEARGLAKRQREEAFKEPETPVEKSIRKGREIRSQGNVSSQELKDTIGLKAVNFGDWMKQPSNAKERQEHVNSAFDAFHDLAEVLNLPVKAMSLDGMLGLAIGAQGKGKYAAHFYPGYNEINLTRMSGAGSLAHEWAHALDHYFGVQAGLASRDEPFASWLGRQRSVPESIIRKEIVDAFNTIVEIMRSTTETAESAKERVDAQVKYAQEKLDTYIERNALDEAIKGNVKAEAALDAIKKGEAGEYVEWPPLKGKRKPQGYTDEHVKTIADALGWNYSRASDLSSAANGQNYAKESASKEPELKKIHTDFYREAAKLDSGKKDSYWTTPHELFARAFEMYVAEKIANADGRNDYLVAAWKQAEEINTGSAIIDDVLNEAKKRYPQGNERKAINEAFDVLFKEIQTKETDTGTALFSRSKSSVPLATQLQSIVDGDNPTKGKLLTIADNSPASLQMLGFDNLPVVTRTGADGVLKMHYEHGLSVSKLANVIENGLKRPAMILQHKGQGDVESLRFVTNEMHNGNPVILAIQPDKTNREGERQQLIATAFEVNAETISRAIANGDLLYRDTTAAMTDNVKKAVTRAQIKYARESRIVLGIIPNAALTRRQAYKVLSQSDIVKFEGNNEGSFFSRNNTPTFYSALSRAIDGIQTKKADPAMWKGMIRNLTQKGVKPDEIEWTGVNEWLDLQKGVVTKEQVQDYLNSNGVQVSETIKGEALFNAETYNPKDFDAMPTELQDLVMQVDDGDIDEDGFVEEAEKLGYKVNMDIGGSVTSITKGDAPYEPTKYKGYVVDGGKNYKELLLTLPYETNKPTYEQWKENQLFLDENNDVSRAKYEDQVGFYDRRGSYAKGKLYKSTHFEQPNILAHIRFDERTDADGNKVLFINEIQSDFGQDFKKAKAEINNAVDNDFNGIIERMKKAGVLEVQCD
jgi:GGDEF domain-containing protein